MAEKILIVDDDLDTLRLVGLMLQKLGYQISAASNGAQGLAKALEERPDLILLDVMMPDMDGYEVTRRLRKNPATDSIPILMFTAKTQLDDKVVGFEVGADDYLTKPTHPTELQAHVKALLARAPQKPTVASDIVTAIHERHGYVIGVLAARGGMGVSTVASNLAASLFNKTQSDVVLAEMVPGFGTYALEYGITPRSSMNDILQGSSVEVTREKVQSAFTPHVSGLKLFLASDQPRDIALASRVENFAVLLNRLSTYGRFVVLDLGAGLHPFVQKILPMCAEKLIVLDSTMNSIHRTKLLIDDIAGLKVDRKTINAVLNNRYRSESQIPLKVAQEKLGHTILASLTPAPDLFIQAERAKSSVVVAQPASVIVQQFMKLAESIIEREQARNATI